MRRVVVVGCGGSGKTVLARQMGESLGIPVVHLDALFYDEGWEPCGQAEFAARQERAVAAAAWVMDGNYASTLPIRLRAADAVVFLDLPAWQCLVGVAQRRLRYRGGQRRTDGVFDRISWSFVRYIVGYRRGMAPKVRALVEAHARPEAAVFVLRSRRAVRRFCDQVTIAQSVPTARSRCEGRRCRCGQRSDRSSACRG